MSRRRKYWIQRAIRNPGALSRQLRRGLARKIAAATRSPVYTKDGEINTRTLIKFTKTQAYQKLDQRTKRRINLAITLEKLRKG